MFKRRFEDQMLLFVYIFILPFIQVCFDFIILSIPWLYIMKNCYIFFRFICFIRCFNKIVYICTFQCLNFYVLLQIRLSLVFPSGLRNVTVLEYFSANDEFRSKDGAHNILFQNLHLNLCIICLTLGLYVF